MRYKYVLYPEARFRLGSSGLLNRIKKANQKSDISILGYVNIDEIPEYVSELNKRGYIKTLMQKGDASLIRRLDKAFQEPETHKWKVERIYNGTVEEDIEAEDFLAMSGWKASNILKPKEIWNYKKFGFENLTDFLGTFAAAMEDELRGDSEREGRIWKTTFPDGRIVMNQISGDGNSDFRLYQTDITPYRTIDPIGNEVSYRPKFELDNKGIIAAHSVEPYFLVSILKWIEQTGIINQDALKINIKEIISQTKKLGQHGGTTAEHFGGFDQSPMIFFPSFNQDIPQLQPGFKTKEWTPYHISRGYGGSYGTYLHPNGKDLIYSLIPGNDEDEKEKRMPSAEFMPVDAIPLIEGMLYQCTMGLGRTSARQVVSILEYYFSPEMKEEQERIKKL